MKIYPIEAGNFKLDGGGIFGTLPKSMWSKNIPSDNDNLVDLSARCLLIEKGKRLILVDTGMGGKQSDKFFGFYKYIDDNSLQKSIEEKGFFLEEITDVFFTHLHFDHCGGAMKWDTKKEKIVPVFKNAIYWTNKDHWEWATKPNPREKASFLTENILPIEESGKLKFIDFKGKKSIDSNENDLGIEILRVDGHTDAQMLPILKYKEKKILYIADLVPFAQNIPINYVVGFDTRPLITMEEKKIILEKTFEDNYIIMFEHDPKNILIDLQKTEKGIIVKNSYSWNEVFGN